MFIHIVSFTANGAKVCSRLVERLGPDSMGFAPGRYCVAPNLKPLEIPVKQWAEERFHKGDALVFVGAVGIAVRAIGPLLQGKGNDPAVVCVDEGGSYVIPLLSCHLGGANLLAKRIARLLKAKPVITTATDVRGVFAVDNWALGNGCSINNLSKIKEVSSSLLDGEPVGFVSDFPVDTELPPNVYPSTEYACGILVSLEEREPFPHTLHLIPKCLRVGIGCRKGADAHELEKLLLEIVDKHNLPMLALESIATISIKVREPAILELSEKYSLPVRVFTPQELSEVENSVASSDFVFDTVGVDNVCERAALCGGGTLLVPKTVGKGVTMAVAKADWKAQF